MTIESPWMTREEAAAYSRRHKNTVNAAARAHALQSSQTGTNGRRLFHKDDLDAWVLAGCPVTAPHDRKVSA